MTAGGLMGGLGPRERRWLLGFLILGSAYFAVLLLQMAFAFMAGFSQIILIVFLAWLLAFIMSPIARFLEERLPLSRPLAVVISYLLALVGLAFVMFVAGGAITGEVGQITTEFPQTSVRIEDTLAGYEKALGLDCRHAGGAVPNGADAGRRRGRGDLRPGGGDRAGHARHARVAGADPHPVALHADGQRADLQQAHAHRAAPVLRRGRHPGASAWDAPSAASCAPR